MAETSNHNSTDEGDEGNEDVIVMTGEPEGPIGPGLHVDMVCPIEGCEEIKFRVRLGIRLTPRLDSKRKFGHARLEWPLDSDISVFSLSTSRDGSGHVICECGAEYTVAVVVEHADLKEPIIFGYDPPE